MSASDQTDQTDQTDQIEYTAPKPNLSGFGGRSRGSSLQGLATPGGAQRPPVSSPPPPDDATASPPAAAPIAIPPPPAPAVEAPAPQVRPSAEPAGAAVQHTAPESEEPVAPVPAGDLPDLSIDTEDPAALVVSPTVLSVPEPLMRRFERARRAADSNTAVVLDALRAHLAELPQLVATARRPATAAPAGEPFPWRTSARSSRPATKVRRVQLPIRPLAGELQVIDILVGWVQHRLGTSSRSLGGRTTRSEVVVAALDAYLPAERRRGDSARTG